MPIAGLIANLAVPAHALVTGASSGIGLAATTALLAREDVARVFALSRRATTNDALAALTAVHGDRMQCIDADLTDEAAIASAVARIAARTDALHLLFNAAGILHADDLQPEKSLSGVSAASLQRVFALNAFAPLLLAKALLPLLPRDRSSVLASLSARVGSIGDNRLGGWYAYRASKAAQNQLWRTLSVELQRTHRHASCVLLHPGTVDTPLSQPFQTRVPAERLFTAQRAAKQLLEVISAVTPEHTGRFLAWDGSEIPW